jgi:TetR/AcrR family transcriptional regulator, tetracycline repressor protein
MAPSDPASTAKPPATASAPRRARWGTLSRDQVIDAAMKLVSERGSEELTIRALAAELGVAPMSLYRHVRDKNDLLDEVVDRLLAHAWQPHAPEDDWRAWISEAAENFRRFLVEQPAALHVYLSHPVVSPTAITRMQAITQVLRQVLGKEHQARQAYAALHTYTLGFAALEASRATWASADRQAHDLAHQLAAYTTPEQFHRGLKYLLNGIDPHRDDQYD